MEQSILEAIDYVRNVSRKDSPSRIKKISASNLDTRSLEKELHQMIAKRLIGSSYKIVNNINLELMLKPHRCRINFFSTAKYFY